VQSARQGAEARPARGGYRRPDRALTGPPRARSPKLKARLAWQTDLDTFRAWYNHARSHQSLGGLTRAMAWAGITEGRGHPHFFVAWDSLLTGLVTPT
jgi:hypothetical protein